MYYNDAQWSKEKYFIDMAEKKNGKYQQRNQSIEILESENKIW